MDKKRTIYLPVIFALILVAGMILGYKLIPVSTTTQIFQMPRHSYSKVADIMSFITEEYVDTINPELLTEEGIKGMLDNLDPHSQYITAEEFNAVTDPLLGNFEGIGIQFRIENDSIVVISTIPGGPSEEVGLMAGDRIVTVDDSLIAGVDVTNRMAMKMLKGPRGTDVEVEIFRRGLPGLLNFTITRDVIPTYSVDFSFMVNDSIGYINVSKFSATTVEEFKEHTANLLNKGMKELILDLRGNTGGYLKEAIDMSDEFLVKDKLIVFTEGAHQPRESYYATDKGALEDVKLVVLIDENSASASEIVAGAIQDNDRGLIVGRRSFGKGLVQRQLDLPDGSALRLTIARYHTPTGRCIQKPYDKEDGFEEYYAEAYHRYENGEMFSADSAHLNDSLKYITAGGNIVYGGGGIMPDAFIPIDTSETLKYYNRLLNKGLIFRFAFEYTDKNRAELNNYESFDDFDENFEITDILLDELLNFAQKNGLKADPEGLARASNKTGTLLKAYIARNLFDNEGFYPMFLRIDDAFNYALNQLTGTDC